MPATADRFVKSASAILVTGATGFVGQAVCERLAQAGYALRGTCRDPLGQSGRGAGGPVDELIGAVLEDPAADWTACSRGVEAVVHLAARVHVMEAGAASDLDAFRRANVDGTLRLARAASAAGARRFVFLSSVKVNGERSPQGADGRPRPFVESDTPQPQDAYAVSKWEAEQGLQAVAAETGLEVTIVRPPLVYGPGVRANFLQLLRWVNRGLPLPLGAVRNTRSLVYSGNLADAVLACVERRAAANRTFLLSDCSLSTPALVGAMAAALGRSARLLPVPVPALRLLGRISGRAAAVDRLLNSLNVDSSAIRRELGWSPPWSMEEGMRRTAQWFLAGAAT